ncbi:MAG: acyl-CoA dehydrogenase family protein, partial [Acidobacteria bacterium]|nr:acyl-CoA dehydrogenase family protein [Acidobacteriota bacterium]
MDFHFSEEQQQFRMELRAWLKENLERPWIEELRDPKNDEKKLFDIRRSWQAKLHESGYLGIHWPKEWGGRGLTVVENAIFAAEAIHAPPIASRVGINLLGPALIHHATEEQRKRFIPKMLSGEEVWCQGFSEPDAGSDLAALRTRAEPDGDDFRLEGQKVWTTFAPWSDWIFVLARTDPDDRYGGITFFLVSLHQEGIEVRPIRQITGESEFGEVFFSGALAKREHMVGALGEGWKIAMTVLAYERGSMSLAHLARFDHYLKDLVEGVRGGEGEPSPALRMQQDRPHPATVGLGLADAGEPEVRGGGHTPEHQLDVGHGQARFGLDIAVHAARQDRRRPAAEQGRADDAQGHPVGAQFT